ncbi:hypothetical protein F2Q69_00062803 [Brassica cretica]|uniref:Secreted protein n=1 Tax=Brassica cretica TaxID=69181 RepID=A0A8S9RDL3_BRACR|nr:hypothetical protein F2Q69_00062803 [Brassica cretica]
MRGFSGRVLLLRLGSVLFSRCGCGGFPASSVSLSLLGLVDPALMTWICCRFQLVALEVSVVHDSGFCSSPLARLWRGLKPLSCSGKFCRWFLVTDACGAKGSVVWCFSTSSFSPNKSFVLVRILSAALRFSTGDYSTEFMFVALLMVNRC